jgi:ATP-dependent DNA helicase RecQ
MQQPVNLDQALSHYFAFNDFQTGQREVIEALINGHSALALFPTGGGKSLCYQLPALLLPGLTLVVSPLIALMKDQIDALQQRGIAAAKLDSTLDATAYHAVIEQARNGTLSMLYVAPERFNNERFRATIMRLPIALMAIDEAHCISEWGHNFRPDYLKLPEFARQCGAERVLALTATATRQVQEDICHAFAITPDHAIRTSFYRPNLTLITTPLTAAERNDYLLTQLQSRSAGSTIVYVTLQRTAEAVAEYLNHGGLSARPYHAGLKDDERSATQEWFMASDRGIVVATIAFGMGVDKSDIRYIYHYNLPKSLENYAQEIGRAGRDGQNATCETLVCVDDLNVLENFIYGDTPTATAIAHLLQELFSQDDDFDVSLYQLSATHDIRPLVLRTLLTYLELEGYLTAGTPFYADYSFKPLQTSAQILSNFTGERRAFIANIFRQAHKNRIWFTLDVNQVAKTLGSNRERVIHALDYLAEQGMLAVKVSGVRNTFHLQQRPNDLSDLADMLYQRACRHQTSELGRLQQVLDLITYDGCQSNALGHHFDNARDQACGHCSYCQQPTAITLPPRHNRESEAQLWQQVMELRGTTPLLHEPVALARFLCGISSPHINRAKLNRHPLFGSCADIPFDSIMQRSIS